MVGRDGDYLDLFQSRHDDNGREKWLSASIDMLRAYSDEAKNDSDVAAKKLIVEQSFDVRRSLAYSAYCFWYQPLFDYAKANPSINGNLGDIPDNGMMNNLAKMLLGSEQMHAGAGVGNATLDRLNLTITAHTTLHSGALI